MIAPELLEAVDALTRQDKAALVEHLEETAVDDAERQFISDRLDDMAQHPDDWSSLAEFMATARAR